MVYRRRPDKMGDSFAKISRQVRRLHTHAPLGYSSISEGSLTVRSNEGLIVDGSAKVTGWLIVTGILRLVGTLQLLGTMIAEGVIELVGSLIVKGAGFIRVEGGESPATLSDGKLAFDTGGELEADVANGGARLRADDAVVNVGNVASIRKGSTSVIAGPDGVTINAADGGSILLQGAVAFAALPVAPAGVTTVPLVYAPSTGRVYREA